MAELKTEVLIPGVPIRLAVVTSSDPTRFRNAFLDTWRKLPQHARDILVVRWTISNGIVYLTVKWSGCDTRFAQCSVNGSQFHFLSSVIDHLPDDVLRICVAHELAHGFFFASGDPYHCGIALPEDIRLRLAESLVHELCDIWGFPSRQLSRWCVDNANWLEKNAAPGV